MILPTASVFNIFGGNRWLWFWKYSVECDRNYNTFHGVSATFRLITSQFKLASSQNISTKYQNTMKIDKPLESKLIYVIRLL